GRATPYFDDVPQIAQKFALKNEGIARPDVATKFALVNSGKEHDWCGHICHQTGVMCKSTGRLGQCFYQKHRWHDPLIVSYAVEVPFITTDILYHAHPLAWFARDHAVDENEWVAMR